MGKIAIQLPSPIEEINLPLLRAKGVQLLVKREDLIHPQISGNKWRKLMPNIQQAKALGHTTLLTFGGAFSNHIAATAAAGKRFGFRTVGLIRGEATIPLNPTLQLAVQNGMELHCVSRTDYRTKNRSQLAQSIFQHPFYELPEGGTNELAVIGCTEIIAEVRQQLAQLPDYCCVAVGTGGTISGIIKGLKKSVPVIGFAALKGNSLQRDVITLLGQPYANWTINTDFHFGGYAKFKPELIEFINAFYQQTGIPLDPVYTGKMFYGILELIKADYFPKSTTILAIHTGGLQGIQGFNFRYGDQLVT